MITEITDRRVVSTGGRGSCRAANASISGSAGASPSLPAQRGGSDEHEEIWLALVVAVVTAGTAAAVRWPAWGEMIVIALGLYAMCKQVTWWRATRGGIRGSGWRQIAYLLAWPGMDARAFIFGNSDRRVTAREWTWAVGKITAGVALTWVVARMAGGGFVSGWIAMIGLVMAFHFGLFHVLELMWKTLGVDVRGVMREPWRSASIAELWGKRWNVAYRDLTHRLVFGPLVNVMPAGVAVMLGFGVSGIVHEMVISVPARGGYGLPTLYFLIQGAAVLIEKSLFAKRATQVSPLQRLWTWIVVVGPMGVLFHPWFVSRVVLPMLQAMRAI